MARQLAHPIGIGYRRMVNQHLAGNPLGSPAAVVTELVAMQAEDYSAAKWGVALRLQDGSGAEIEQAFSMGAILRTHVMRPTWHLVSPRDIRWLLELTAPRVHAANASRYRTLELDAGIFKRSHAAIEKVLAGGNQLTRAELGTALARAGISAKGIRLAHIMMHAELDALICSGAWRGKQFTYALLDERAPLTKPLTRDQALVELTGRYFAARGPATLKDFGWWSGLVMADARAGLEACKPKLISETFDGQTYWVRDSAPPARKTAPVACVVSIVDEYIMGYVDRSPIAKAVGVEKFRVQEHPHIPFLLLLEGRFVGALKRTLTKDMVQIESTLFKPLNRTETRAVQAAVKRYAAFLERGLEGSID